MQTVHRVQTMKAMYSTYNEDKYMITYIAIIYK